ncbi:MAG: hypothetical protein K9N05_07570 [Candidatus Marinimicrobia bacterium]|nr:hypothetical protein [Candidatus Neomarinimicrobiota bacterium]
MLISINFIGCSELMPLPETGDSTGVINTDPNKYTQLTPIWTFDQFGLQNPTDAFFKQDGRMYIADSSINSIMVIRQFAEVESGCYDSLLNLDVKPTSVCVDSRFNVYFSDGGNKIYMWSQYATMFGIKGIVTERLYEIDGKDTLLSPLDAIAILGYEDAKYPKEDIIDTTQVELIDSLMSPRVFYDPQNDLNRNGLINDLTGEVMYPGNKVYATVNKSYVALAPGESGELSVFAADAINNYILKIDLIPTVLVHCSNGQNVWQYIGILDRFIATPGTGAGTVSKPVSLSSDESGNLYYTQTGDYFSAHKIEIPDYTSSFSVGQDILRIGEFGYARDILSADQTIFVLDNIDNDIKLYSPQEVKENYIVTTEKGEYLKSIAVTEEWVIVSDTTYINDSLVVKDTLVLNQYNDLLDNPMAITFYDEVIYVFDNGNSRILRYTKADDVVIEDADREE